MVRDEVGTRIEIPKHTGQYGAQAFHPKGLPKVCPSNTGRDWENLMPAPHTALTFLLALTKGDSCPILSPRV